MSRSNHQLTGFSNSQSNLARSSHQCVVTAYVMVFVGLLATATTAQAQDRSISPIFEIGVDYEDNPRLVTDSLASDIIGGQLVLGLNLERRTETSSISLRPRIDIRNYSGSGDNNSEDFYLNLGMQNQGLRSDWRLSADFRQEQVLQGELPVTNVDDSGPDDPIDTVTGFIREKRQRNKFDIRPGFSFDLSENNAINFDLSYVDVSYDNQAVTQAVDFAAARLDTSFTHRLTEQSDIKIGAYASQYETDTSFNVTKSTGLLARYSRSVSELSTWYVEAGVEAADIERIDGLGVTTTSSETVPILSVGIDRAWQLTRLRMTVDHSARPSGSGFLLERDQVRVTVDRQLRPRWSVQFSGVGLTTETLGTTTQDINDTNLVDTRFTIAYELSRKWILKSSVSYTYIDDTNEPGTQTSVGANVSIAYRPLIQVR